MLSATRDHALLWRLAVMVSGALLVAVALGTHRAGAAEPSAEATGPEISQVVAFGVTQTNALIAWTLDEPGTGQVEYGTTPEYGQVTNPELSFDYTTHIQDIEGLQPGTLYHFRVRSTNRAGFESVSEDSTFTTLATPTPAPQPQPSPSGPVTSPEGYDAVFEGDPTGTDDVSSELAEFMESHAGKRVALAPGAIYRVTQVEITAHDLTVDFRGARLQGDETGVHGILRLQDCTNVTLNDAAVYGTGYAWAPVDQNEHGIHIDGGSTIILNHPVTRDTRGDGIYLGFLQDWNEPSRDVEIIGADIQRAARNGIAPVAGEVTIVGGTIAQTGLHSIDFEPNNDEGATSIRGIVDGVDTRQHGDIPGIELSSYAVAAGGKSRANKISVIVRNMTGDDLRMTIRDTEEVVVQGNTSDVETTATFIRSPSVTFEDNVRISRGD